MSVLKNGMVSVIVPVYNVEEYLRHCVKSIVYQTYQNLEIMLVDDGSTDSSGEICEELAQEYKRVHVIHKKNGGLSSARNAGLDVANGEYIAFVDSDDFIHKSMYEIMVSAFAVSFANYVECNHVRVTNGDFKCVTSYGLSISNQYEVLSNMIDIDWTQRKHHIIVCNKLFKKNFIQDFRFDLGKIHEDVFFFNKYWPVTEKVISVNAPFYHYRTRPGSIMNQTFTTRHAEGFHATIDGYGLVKHYQPSLSLKYLAYVDRCYNRYLNQIDKLGGDTDFKIRSLYSKFVLELYDEMMYAKTISKVQKAFYTDLKNEMLLTLRRREVNTL